MKKVIISFLVIACIVCAVLVAVSKKASEPLNNARKLENSGDFFHALSSYLSALSQMTDARPVPSKTIVPGSGTPASCCTSDMLSALL